jgi:hypothetical protein
MLASARGGKAEVLLDDEILRFGTQGATSERLAEGVRRVEGRG